MSTDPGSTELDSDLLFVATAGGDPDAYSPPPRVWVLISDCGLNGPWIHGVFTTEPSLRIKDEAISQASHTTGYQNTKVEEFYLNVPESS